MLEKYGVIFKLIYYLCLINFSKAKISKKRNYLLGVLMMSQTLLEILPYLLGSAIAPFEIIITLLLLKSQHNGLGQAGFFLLGIITTRILQGNIFGLILNRGATADTAHGNNPVIYMLLLVGILHLNKAFKIIKKNQTLTLTPRNGCLL